MWADVETFSYPLAVCTVPGALLSGKRSSGDRLQAIVPSALDPPGNRGGFAVRVYLNLTAIDPNVWSGRALQEGVDAG